MRRVSLVCNDEPITIDLACGIVLLCLPFSSFINEKAKIIAAEWVSALSEGELVVNDLNGEIIGLPDGNDAVSQVALGRSLFTEALAGEAVKDWENVIDLETGDELELTYDNVRGLMRSAQISEEFHRKYTMEFNFFLIEGKE